ALEASKTVLDVRRVVRFAPLAVIDDVQAGVELLADALADGFAYASVEGRHVVQTALLPGHEHLEQVVGARQAAAVGGQDMVRAPLHRQPPYRTQAQSQVCDAGEGVRLPDAGCRTRQARAGPKFSVSVCRRRSPAPHRSSWSARRKCSSRSAQSC